jgi:hypothetical protein
MLVNDNTKGCGRSEILGELREIVTNVVQHGLEPGTSLENFVYKASEFVFPPRLEI